MDEEIKIPNNLEIDKALKEFEAKNAEQKQQTLEALKTPVIPQKEIVGIKFETDSYKAVNPSNETDFPKMVKLVMKWSGGSIREQKQAEYVLLGFVIVVIIISGFLFFVGGNTQTKSEKPSAEMLEQMKQTMPLNNN